MRFAESAYKHGLTEDDIIFVYASMLTKWFPNGTSERGNERAILVGFDMTGNLIEVGVELISDENGDEEYFYHAMKATSWWRKSYERRSGG